MKLSHFLFATLFLLLISFAKSQIEHENPNSRPLGGRCVADHQCGGNAQCTSAGECRCPAGWIPETEFLCIRPTCSSTEFCHVNVTANTVCDRDVCRCAGPNFEQDRETFERVRIRPDTLPLGASCNDSSYCVNYASCTTGSERICKCRLGYEATSDTVCDPVRCSRDEHCHKNVSPLTYCNLHEPGSICSCWDGYYENPATNECSPREVDGTTTEGWIETSTPGWTEASTEAPTEASTQTPTETSTETSTEASDVDRPCGREKLYKSLWLKCEMRRPSCAAGSIDLKLKVKGYGSSKDLPSEYEQ